MIINKQGEKCLCSNGVEYIIGEEVIGTENGDYEGLIGRIYEIRIEKLIKKPIMTLQISIVPLNRRY